MDTGAWLISVVHYLILFCGVKLYWHNSLLSFLVFRCYSLSDDEIQSYLKCLSSCVKSGHSTAAVNEILRYDTLQLAGVRIQVCYMHLKPHYLPRDWYMYCVPLSLDFNYSYSSWKLFQVFGNNLHSGNKAFQVLCPEERTTANKTRRKTLICSVISSHNLYTWAQVLFILVIRDKFVQQKHALQVACINLCISILVNLQFIGYKLIALRHCVTPAKLGLWLHDLP